MSRADLAADNRKPSKVLFYYQDFGAIGGIEKYIEQVAMALSRQEDVEPVIVCSENSPFYQRLVATSKGLKVYGVKSPQFFSKSILRTLDLGALLQLFYILERESPDIVHVHIGLIENLFIKFLGYPVIYSVHGYSTLYSLQADSLLKKLFKNLTRTLFTLTARNVDALVFVSDAERSRMTEEGFVPSGVGEILANGLDIELLRKQALAVSSKELRQSLGIPLESKCVSFINRLDANKNPLQFIHFAEWLSGNMPGLHFIIAGDGPLKSALQERWQRSPINHRIHLLGNRNDIPALIQASDLIVQMSAMEGFGLGVLEALAIGTPCIGYRVGGIPEVLGAELAEKCLVEPGELNSLVERAQKMLLLKEKERNLLICEMHSRSQVFSLSNFISQFNKIYGRVLSSKNFQPLITVILPVYNGADVVLKAIRSVLNQTYQNFELIVINDGSKDETLDVLAAVNDPRITVITQPNLGVARARNLAFSRSVGEYIAFIDADDVWFPEKLTTEIKVLQGKANRKCLIYSSYYAVDEHERLINLSKIWSIGGDLSWEVLRHEGIFLPSTTLVYREIIESVDGFANGCYHEDRAFFIRACQSYPAYPTGKRLVAYRQSMTGRCRSILKNFDQALRAELSIIQTLEPILQPEQVTLLSSVQVCNLFNRFLMYGFKDHAQKLYQQVSPALLKNKKGLLSVLTMKTGINVLAGCRFVAQFWMCYGLLLWWLWQTKSIRSFNIIIPALSPFKLLLTRKALAQNC